MKPVKKVGRKHPKDLGPGSTVLTSRDSDVQDCAPETLEELAQPPAGGPSGPEGDRFSQRAAKVLSRVVSEEINLNRLLSRKEEIERELRLERIESEENQQPTERQLAITRTLDDLEWRVSKTRDELVDAKRDLPEDARNRYNRLRNRAIQPAAICAPLEEPLSVVGRGGTYRHGYCGACKTKVSTDALQRIKRGEIVACTCGVFIVSIEYFQKIKDF